MKLVVDAVLLLELGWRSEGEVWTHHLTPGRFDLDTAIEVTSRAFKGYTGNQAPDWEPSVKDVTWQEQHVNKIHNGGVWQTSEGKFRVYKNDKQVILIHGNPDEGLIKQILSVFKVMGWAVLIRKPEENHGEEN
jgi:hypothetical protein